MAYQGDPKFEPIEKTKVEHAVNTDKDIIKFGDLYYLCFQGVWFMSKSPSGPWEVAASVPKEIYAIPVSSPAHNVTYVTVVEDDDDDDEWVTFATVAGVHRDDGRVGLRGVGQRLLLPALLGLGRRLLPVLLPALSRRYGYGAWYNPWTGRLRPQRGRVRSLRRRRRHARATTRRPAPTRAARRPGGRTARAAPAQAYNPRTGTYAQTRQGSNVYGSWGSTAVQRGDDWAQTARVTNNRTGTTTRVTQGSGGGDAITRNRRAGGGTVASCDGSGDVYAGPRRQRLPEIGRRLAEVRRERRLEQREQA